MQARLTKKLPDIMAPGCDDERVLQDEIAAYCNNQFPKWKFIRCRMDQPSTIAVGAQDFTIFLPGGRVFCIECKAGNKKRTPEQDGWALEMSKLGHEVHLIRSFDRFLEILEVVK